MKFRKLRTLEESLLLETVIRLDNCYATSSKTDLRTLLTKDQFIKRIAYCDDEWLWIVGTAYATFHYSMVEQGVEKGLTGADPMNSSTYGRFYYIPRTYQMDIEDKESLVDCLEDTCPGIDIMYIYEEFIIAPETDHEPGLDKLLSLFDDC